MSQTIPPIAPAPARARLPLVFILATVAIDSIGIGLIFPVMPELIRDLTGRSFSDAALWGGVLATSFAVMQFLFGPVVGNLSDRFGRKPVLLSAMAIMAVDYLAMAVAHTIWLLLLTRTLAGITAATHSTATAYMADVSAPEDRETSFGYIGAAFGAGFVLGPLIGGLLATVDVRVPFYAAAVLAGVNFVFGALVVPESLPRDKRRAFSWGRSNPLASFAAIGKLPGLAPLLLLLGLYHFAFFVYPAIWAFYGQANFGWGPDKVGYSLATFGICMAIAQALLVAPAIKRFGAYRTALGGLALDAVVFAAYGVITAPLWIFVFIPISALGSVVGPAIQGIMSRAAPDDQQGELQGVVASVMAVATILSPLVMTWIFARFTHEGVAIPRPGAPFLLSSLMLICAMGLLVLWQRKQRPDG
ncbi:Tetracycline resistance protein, class C [Aquimixticola soesokkakensis]|uniref:Tetracycline resistance protein, class C n=1 Tax=Aquimixticola soesokkakensis TaxID=1519096 RepID=A0A1Y5TG97_9RHOB|nr:TCR/Tet family MFS transporter [Aquimixticola soesokkakensis]SLN59727.1 Tetracycline resistance protein, class C [Aquimixticola soesokkakensis]